MPKENINITVKGDTLTILEGKAPEQLSIIPDVLNITGNLKAPGLFWNARENLYPPEDCIVLYNKNKMTIGLNLKCHSPYSDLIIGVLSINPDLQAFNIGKDQHSPKELAKFLKSKRAFFRDKDEHQKVLAELSTLKAKVNAQLENINDERGNKRELFEKTVESNVPLSFVLALPIFVGYEKAEFTVEICLDSTDSRIICWLESPELTELIDIQKTKIIEEELKNFTDLVCIEQ